MKWQAVLRAASAVAAADPILTGLFPVIRMAGTGKHQVPLLEYFKVAAGESELWAPVTIQWDVWCLTFEELVVAQQQLYALFHVETQRDFGGMPMWSQYQDSEDLATPDRDNYFGAAVRYVMIPLRARYEPVPVP